MRVFIEEKRFGDKLVFSNAEYVIPSGRRSLLLGPSGKGKTTLMRILSGLDRDFKGQIEGMPQRPLVLFQEDRLVESISVLSNLMAVTDDRRKASSVLAELGLGGEERNLTSALSGGMKRRLSIARLLLLDGDMLFLDEPFRGLDEEMKGQVASVLSAFAGDRTLLLITHDEDDGKLMAATEEIRI